MAVLDAHVHFYPPELNADPVGWAQRAREPHWATLCTRVRKSGRPVQGFPSVDQLLREMDAAGVEQAVLLSWYWEQPETCRTQNRFLARVAQAHPQRLWFFGAVSPLWTEGVLREELHRLRDEGCRGLGELSPHTQGHGPLWEQVWALAGAWGWPVNLHVTDPHSRPYPGRQETPLEDFLDWAKAYPKTNYILAHWGGGPAALPALAALPNVAVDTAASPLLYPGSAEGALLRQFPAERIFWGSDFPLDLAPQQEGAGWRAYRESFARLPGFQVGQQGENFRRWVGLR